MKILVLMPLDEKWVYAATAIWDKMDDEIRDHCFAMPMFMETTVVWGRSRNWFDAAFFALKCSEYVYKTAEKEGDPLIIIGNMPKDFKFDVVFNFQDMEETLPYEDRFMDRIKKALKEIPLVGKESSTDSILLEGMVSNLYTAEDSTFSLTNCQATADFLSAYMKSEIDFKEIEEEYKKALEEITYAI